VPRKHTTPVVKNVRLGEGQIVATDLEVAVAIALPAAEGQVLLPHGEALEVLRYAPGHLAARITSENGTVTIAVGEMESHFKVPALEDFPPVAFIGPDQLEHQGVLEGDALVRAMAAVLPSAATESSKPVLCGVCLTVGDEVKVVCADGYRLAWEKVPGRLPGDGNILLSATAVRLLGHLWKKAAAPDLSAATNPAQVAVAKRLIRLQWDKQQLQVRFGRVVLLSRLIQGTFPSYNQLIPTDLAASVTIDAGDMLRALQQVKGRAREGSGIVRLSWDGDRLQVSAQAAEVGDTTVPLRAHSTAPGKTAVNIFYLMAYFKGQEGSVTMTLAGTEGAPITFAHRGTPHIIMMPMFVKKE
jgi:DNA polymerase-3 subunit beta